MGPNCKQAQVRETNSMNIDKNNNDFKSGNIYRLQLPGVWKLLPSMELQFEFPNISIMFKNFPPPCPRDGFSNPKSAEKGILSSSKMKQNRNNQNSFQNPEGALRVGSIFIKQRLQRRGQPPKTTPLNPFNPNSNNNIICVTGNTETNPMSQAPPSNESRPFIPPRPFSVGSTYGTNNFQLTNNSNNNFANGGNNAAFLTHNSGFSSNKNQLTHNNNISRMENKSVTTLTPMDPLMNFGNINKTGQSTKPTVNSTLANKQSIGSFTQLPQNQNNVVPGTGFQTTGMANTSNRTISHPQMPTVANYTNPPNYPNYNIPENQNSQPNNSTQAPSPVQYHYQYQNQNQNQNQNQEVQLKTYMESMVSNLITPYIQALTQLKKAEMDIAKQEQKVESKVSISELLTKFDDECQKQDYNPRQMRRKRTKETIIIKIVHESKQERARKIQEDRAFFDKIKQQYHLQKYGVQEKILNSELYRQQRRPINPWRHEINSKELTYMNYQKKKERIMKKEQTSKRMHQTEVFVSDFGEVRNLEYTVDLRWAQEPNRVKKTFKKSTVQVSDRPSDKQLEESILLDLRRKGQKIKSCPIFKLSQLEYKKSKPNILMRLFFGSKEVELKDFTLTGTIFERKINLPYGYEYQPKTFQGFKVNNLKIRNKFGSILWQGETDVTNLNFQNGIRIANNEVEVKIPSLEKQAIVQFQNLPWRIQGVSRERIQRNLKRIAKGAELLSFDIEKKTWRMRIDFSRQQNEVENEYPSEDLEMTRAEFQE